MSENEAIRTAFHEVTAAQGGSHVEDGGWMWLEGFGDVAKEYAAIRDDVAVWDVSPLNKWEFRGPDALRGAQRAFSNDALGLEVGQVRYGAFVDADGLMVDDGTVFNTGAGGPLLGDDQRPGPRGVLRGAGGRASTRSSSGSRRRCRTSA